jgi:hypothetical protein
MWDVFRERAVALVLGTDMKQHFSTLGQFESRMAGLKAAASQQQQQQGPTMLQPAPALLGPSFRPLAGPGSAAALRRMSMGMPTGRPISPAPPAAAAADGFVLPAQGFGRSSLPPGGPAATSFPGNQALGQAPGGLHLGGAETHSRGSPLRPWQEQEEQPLPLPLLASASLDPEMCLLVWKVRHGWQGAWDVEDAAHGCWCGRCGTCGRVYGVWKLQNMAAGVEGVSVTCNRLPGEEVFLVKDDRQSFVVADIPKRGLLRISNAALHSCDLERLHRCGMSGL